VKRRRVIFLATTSVAALVISLSILSHCTGPQARVEGNWRAEDVSQIQRAVRRDRWEVAKACLVDRNLKLFFGLCVPDTAFGRVREIGPIPDHFAIGFGASDTNPSSRAYVLSGGWYSRRSIQYGLVRTTNEWKVTSWKVTSFGCQQ
jgi:hypothetical protein